MEANEYCPACGEKIINPGGHAERCTGEPPPGSPVHENRELKRKIQVQDETISSLQQALAEATRRNVLQTHGGEER